MNNNLENEIISQDQAMSRRRVLKIIGLAGTALTTASLISQQANADGHRATKGMTKANKYQALIDACTDCKRTTSTCLDHCIALVADEDTSIAACLASTRALLPVLDAMVTLASSQSEHVNSMAKVCVSVCEDCRIECEKHAHHHAECKACMESCEGCIEQLKRV